MKGEVLEYVPLYLKTHLFLDHLESRNRYKEKVSYYKVNLIS